MKKSIIVAIVALFLGLSTTSYSTGTNPPDCCKKEAACEKKKECDKQKECKGEKADSKKEAKACCKKQNATQSTVE